MARPTGALNKRTRAALAAAAEGKLGEKAEDTIAYLLKIANDPTTEHNLRVQAANAALPYCKPRLASIEQTNIDPRDEANPAELLASMASAMIEKPQLFETVLSAVLEKSKDHCAAALSMVQRFAPELIERHTAPATPHILPSPSQWQ